MQRVLVYVDGFNLYFGLRSQGWKRFYWLDLPALATAILQQQQQLEMVKYSPHASVIPLPHASGKAITLKPCSRAQNCKFTMVSINRVHAYVIIAKPKP